MILYQHPASGNCYKVRLLLAQLERPYQTIDITIGVPHRERPRDMLDMTPVRRIPTLVLPDGEPLFESNAILTYLAEGTRYIPEDRLSRARTLAWMFFEQNLHEPNIATARYWRHIAKQPERRSAVMPLWEQTGYEALSAMERHLSEEPFFGGQRYTIADIALYAYTHVADQGGFELGRFPAIGSWMARVRDQPGHVTIDATPNSVAGRA